MMGFIKQSRVSLSLYLLAVWGLLIIGASSGVAEGKSDEINFEAGFYYTVKEGDTLWDLSQRFDDTPWQWPDLWEKNKQITNPHWIYPGERIRLFRKKGQHQIQTAQKIMPPTDAQITASAPAAEPPPEVQYFYANMDRIGFIRKPPVDPLGTIFKARDNKTLISKGDLIYIRHSDTGQPAAMSPGMRLTVYRTMSPLDDRKSEKTIGTQHFILGIAEVVKNEERYTLAKILKSFRAIHIDDLVMVYTPRNSEITIVNSTPGIDGRIIVSEDHSKLLGELFIAFIDKGRQDNILPGQIYNLYYQETAKSKSDNTIMLLDKIDIGSILVLHTEQTTSTVVITDSSRQILPGQPFHTP